MGPMRRLAPWLLCLAACVAPAEAQVVPSGSLQSSAFEASTPRGLRCFAVDSTTDYLTDGTNPLFVPEGVTVRLHARGELCAAYVQSVDDLTFDTTTCVITDAASTCVGAACPDGAGAGISLGAGAVDYLRLSSRSFQGNTSPGGARLRAVATRDGTCESATAESNPRIPCDETADCTGQGLFTNACDTAPDAQVSLTGGFIAAGAASATTLCISWF